MRVSLKWSLVLGPNPATLQTLLLLSAKKMKNLCYELKRWSRGISKLKLLIQNNNDALVHLDSIVDKRALVIQENNFRRILKLHLNRLLKYQNEY